MKKNRISQLIILASIFLTSCGSLGDNFFIRNYENQSVHIKYIYYSHDNITNSTDFRFQPKSFVLFSDTLLNKKQLRQFPYKSYLYFDTLHVSMIDSITYQFDMPARSTISIAGVYWGDNIEKIIINKTDTITFITDYPCVECEEFITQGLIKLKPKLVGDSYYLLNLNQDEISKILKNECPVGKGKIIDS
jgi:hypothetical protein